MFCFVFHLIGATLGKGLNRMAATSSAAALGVGIHNIAFRSTRNNNAGQAVVIGRNADVPNFREGW